jgi:S-adenosylmethionine synthetase
MALNISIFPESKKADVEIVEIKGAGHPDTVCDTIAEEISKDYSRYCLDTFGFILPHMIDKIGVLGGLSNCAFGKGEIVKPITILLNGRLSKNLGDQEIPVEKIAVTAIKNVLSRIFLLLNVDKHVVIQNNLHYSRGPGVVLVPDQHNERHDYYTPKTPEGVMHARKETVCNDTSVVVGYAPELIGEKIARDLERMLFSREFKAAYPFVGTDIKIMLVRTGKHVSITYCIPFICVYTPSLDFYIAQKEMLNKLIAEYLQTSHPDLSFEVFLNTRDNYDKPDLYLTVVGSAIESGDEGLVGRGNRSNGVINVTAPMSIEAFSGKNPVHHVAKVYSFIAQKIAREIYAKSGFSTEVYLVSQMGRSIHDPWKIVVKVVGALSAELERDIGDIVALNLRDCEAVTMALISKLGSG